MVNETVFLGECPIIRPEGIYFGGRKVISLGMGAVERSNPVPVGKYWIDVFDKDGEAFQDWITRNKGSVRVVSTQSFPAVSNWFSPDEPGRNWYLFDVLSPVSWEGPGFPTIATAEIKSEDDTIQRPAKPQDPLDQIQPPDFSGLNKTLAWLPTAAVVVAAVAVGGVIISYLPRRASPTSPVPSRPW